MIKKLIFGTILGVVLAMLFIGVYYFIFSMAFWGEIANILPDTSFAKNTQKVLVRQEDTLYCVDINGAHKMKICDNVGMLTVSPDGRKVAILTNGELSSTIKIINLDNGNSHIVETGTKCYSTNWFPDGTRIAYGSAQGDNFCIFNIAENTKKIVHIPGDHTYRGYFPGVILYIARDGMRIFIYSTEHGVDTCYQYDIASDTISEMTQLIQNDDKKSVFKYVDEKDIYWGHNKTANKNVFEKGKVVVYTTDDGLLINTNGREELLVKYKGYHSGTYAPKIILRGISNDARNVVFVFDKKIYISDIVLKKTGYLIDGDLADFVL